MQTGAPLTLMRDLRAQSVMPTPVWPPDHHQHGVNTQTNLCGIKTHFLHGALTPRQAFPPHQTSPIIVVCSVAFSALQLEILLTLYSTQRSRRKNESVPWSLEGGEQVSPEMRATPLAVATTATVGPKKLLAHGVPQWSHH